MNGLWVGKDEMSEWWVLGRMRRITAFADTNPFEYVLLTNY